MRAIKPNKKNSVWNNNIVTIVISKNGDRYQNKRTFFWNGTNITENISKKAANIGMGLKMHLNFKDAV